MQIGISTACFYARMFTEEAVAYIGETGCPICEVFMDSYSEYERDFAELFANTAAQYGMRIVSVHAMSAQFEPQLFSLGERQRQDAQKLYRKVLEAGRRMGAARYVFHGPALLRGALKNADISRIGAMTAQLADMAADYGIKLCWENVSWCLFNHPSFAAEILEACPSDNLFFTLDIKQALRAGHDPFAFLSAMGRKVAHVHLYDYAYDAQGKLSLLMPGQGVFDFARLSGELQKLGYAGDVVLEVYSDGYEDLQDVRQSWRLLKKEMA